MPLRKIFKYSTITNAQKVSIKKVVAIIVYDIALFDKCIIINIKCNRKPIETERSYIKRRVLFYRVVL
jgi:hypothetical protein